MRSCIARTRAMSASLALTQARRTASTSSVRSTISMSSMSLGEKRRTSAPRPGMSSIRPSLARNFIASRSGVRDTPSWAPSWTSGMRVPGARLPSMIMSLSRLTTASCSGIRAIGSTDPSLRVAACSSGIFSLAPQCHARRPSTARRGACRCPTFCRRKSTCKILYTKCLTARSVAVSSLERPPAGMWMSGERPIIALAMGDPAGISPELTGRLLASQAVKQAAHLVVIGDRRVLDAGARTASVEFHLAEVEAERLPGAASAEPQLIDLRNLDPADVAIGQATPAGGAFATQNFAVALRLANAGKVDAVCFTPFNKKAMRYAYPGYDDEIRFIADAIGFTGRAREFNVLDQVWNARVTSHIPLAD